MKVSNPQGFAMPPPPPSLHTLSEEELKAFEGSTRQAIENRLLILRNVQVRSVDNQFHNNEKYLYVTRCERKSNILKYMILP